MHRDAAYLRQHEGAIVELGPIAILLEGEGVVAVLALEAREAGFLPALHSAEERLIGLVEPRQHILQDMRVHGGVVREVTCSPSLKGRGFSVHRPRQRRDSPKALSAPLDISGRVLVAVQDQSAVRTDMGAH
jgi:hypothetical protein